MSDDNMARGGSLMTQSRRLIILTASYGDGHLQAARSLKQSFLKHGIHDVKIIDLMKEAHPVLNTITTSLYVKSTHASQYGLDYYGWSYYITRDTKPDSTLNKYFNYLGKKKLKAIIDRERPDAMINTFPFGAAPEIGRFLEIPTFTVVTDFALHSRWIHPNTDKYYVATDELRAEMISKGFAPEQIEVSGIPVRQAFYEVSSANHAFRHKLNSGKKNVLISAGSYGVLKNIDDMVNSLMKADCQIMVVCGRNWKLEQRLKKLYAGNSNVHIFGYVENIHELMALSSCIVTKAGGLTLSEALTLNLPIFIFKPFGGQEKENALYLSQKGVAIISRSTDELEAQILQFLADESVSRDIKRRMASFQKEAAADFIAKDVIRSLKREALLST
jgi:processive 1,2-diacylglycerol beta-glucosyltransferase